MLCGCLVIVSQLVEKYFWLTDYFWHYISNLIIIKNLKIKKMKKKLMFLVPIALFFMAGFFNSCNSPQREDDESEIEVKIEEGIDEFKSEIDELDPNDPDFPDKFERKVNDFDERMEEWGEEMEEAGDEVSAETRRAYNNMRRELDKMGNKIDRWANATDEELKQWGDEIKKDFNEFRNNVREWVE